MSKSANEQMSKLKTAQRKFNSQPDSYRVSTNFDLFFTDIFTTFTEKSSKLA